MGVYIGDTKGVFNCSINGNFIVNCTNALYFNNSSSNEISFNFLFNNVDGINLYKSKNNNILNNSITQDKPYSTHGIALWDESKGNNISNNKVFDNRMGVLFSRWCNDNFLWNNNISKNVYGLKIDYSFYNIIINNSFINRDNGILINSCNNNSVVGSTFVGHQISAIYLTGSDDNTIIENDYYDNKENIKKASAPPSIKLPGFETIIFIVLILVVLIIVLFKERPMK
jgi:parallel beta-helix repeat protein